MNNFRCSTHKNIDLFKYFVVHGVVKEMEHDKKKLEALLAKPE